jgi:hypothetical protein
MASDLREIARKALRQASGLHHDRSREYLAYRLYHVLYPLETLDMTDYMYIRFCTVRIDNDRCDYDGISWISTSNGCGYKILTLSRKLGRGTCISSVATEVFKVGVCVRNRIFLWIKTVVTV